MATDSAATMTAHVKAALTGFDFPDAPHTEEMISAIMIEFKAQIAKMVVTTTSGAPDSEHIGVVA